MKRTITTAKGHKGAADRLFSRLVRARGACERCGAHDRLQCAHIISRKYSATRCDLANAWCLCARCHIRVDSHFEDKWALMTRTIGVATFTDLCRLAYGNKGRRWKWANERSRLEALIEEAGL